MIKHNKSKEFTEYDTFSRRKFLESLGMRFYCEHPADPLKKEKTGQAEQPKKQEAEL